MRRGRAGRAAWGGPGRGCLSAWVRGGVCVCVSPPQPPPRVSPGAAAGRGPGLPGGLSPLGLRSPLAPSRARSQVALPAPAQGPRKAFAGVSAGFSPRQQESGVAPSVCNPSCPAAAKYGRVGGFGFFSPAFPGEGQDRPKGNLLPSCGFIQSTQALAPRWHILAISITPRSRRKERWSCPRLRSPKSKWVPMPTEAPSACQRCNSLLGKEIQGCRQNTAFGS